MGMLGSYGEITVDKVKIIQDDFPGVKVFVAKSKNVAGKNKIELPKIVSDEVVDISTNWANVAILKEGKSMWIWGKYRPGKKV